MIALLKGRIITQDENAVVLDVNGVGYQLNLSGAALDLANKSSDQVVLHTHMHVKDDGIDLYGFASADEKKLFQKIITVSGMGCKTALNILKTMRAEQFVTAIALGDRSALTKVSGIGKKTAERLILELKDDFADVYADLSAAESEIPPLVATDIVNDALSALSALGFSYVEAESMIRTAQAELGETDDLQGLLKAALAAVGKRGRA
ncbi:MAG TPA: Holliday junction branch migration protein RuvA [Firmicutes bacterium]|nr:Holliday junction branch migration protein RuvA [Bacillota bacterium]